MAENPVSNTELLNALEQAGSIRGAVENCRRRLDKVAQVMLEAFES